MDEALARELVALRRDLHRFPESGWTEFRTTARIIEELRSLGIPVRWGRAIHAPAQMQGLPGPEMMERCYQRALSETDHPQLLTPMRGGFTGCVAEIQGALPGGTVALRVDIDCCDVSESQEADHLPAAEGFASLHEGCMHACGHDAHAAIGVGAAKLLWAKRKSLHGRVLVIFQPAEEGLRGAASMTAAGVVSDCDVLFGLHVGMHNLKVGTVAASCTGFLSSTKFDVLFHGVPAHAGIAPEQGRNAMAAGARAVLELLDLPSRHTALSRVNVGTFTAGSGRNVIPALAHLAIETRGETAEVNSAVEREALEVCRGAAGDYGCTLETRFMGGAGSAVCTASLAARTAELLKTLPGVETVLPSISFGGGEDVTTMMRAVQGRGGQATELLLGMPLPAPHHSSRFDVDEGVIPLGAEILAALALEIQG